MFKRLVPGSSLVPHFCLLAAVALCRPAACLADTVPAEDCNATFQSTYVWQEKQALHAAYSGPHSLSVGREWSDSLTATANLGVRPWSGGEAYLDAEAAQGVPLSGLAGLGGFTNAEMARTSGPSLTLYRARLFLRQTWGDGGAQEAVESAANQLAGMVDRRRWVLTVGNLSVLDLFDDNAYSHDPRTQFLNLALMSNGAYDYAADARGYSWGAALERYAGDWVVRAGRFIEPRQPNQQALDRRVLRHYGDQIELEHAHDIGGQAGKVRVLAYRDRATMSRYQDALDAAAGSGRAPDLNAVRHDEHIKYGLGLNAEQALSPDLGVFARAGWADGRTETYAFTEIDRSVSGGGLLKGSSWGREQDRVGLALVSNGLSHAHRQYLAAGGEGFFLGDGALRYRRETIVEAFYDWAPLQALWLTLDWQHISNPAYNAGRGPAKVASVRLHTEF